MTTDPARQPPQFDAAFAGAFERLLVWRRDERHFRGDPLDEAEIERLIAQACLAPSVGNSQPWRFVRVASAAHRARVRENFLACNAQALGDYQGERARLYASLKLAGLDEAPVHLAVFSDHATAAGYGLGRKTMPQAVDYSVVAAIHTLWLAARIRGIGVGWVSILDPERIKQDLEVPDSWELVGYLCLGRPLEEHDTPELVRTGWQDREAFEKFLFRR